MANPIVTKKDLSILEICDLMPKVELHAHLNGSISDSIIQRLTQNPPSFSGVHGKVDKDKDKDGSHPKEQNTGTLEAPVERSLLECWKAFAKIHEVIRTPKILFRATCEIIEEFVRDRVVYLELRTTPKKIHEIPSKQVYIDTVIKAIKHCTQEKKLPITVKLLISIDRATSARNYLENVCLAQWYRILHPEILVGLDLCGDPNKGETKMILFALNFAKKMNLQVSIHLPEIINENETKLFLEHGPSRLAHGHYLHPSTGGNTELWKIFKVSGICMEVCITSNLLTGVCPNFEFHYVTHLHDDKIPFVIGTDDCGVFCSSLSQEYKKFLRLVPLTKLELKCLCISSIMYIFGNEVEKSMLTKQMETWWDDHV